jgi:TP901 family phage tail tape measure protein
MAAKAGGIRAGAAFVEMWLNDARLTRGLKVLSLKLKAFGSSITALGTRFAMMGAGIALPLVMAVRHFASAGDAIHKMAARTGIGAAALSEMGFAAERSGTDLATLEKGIRRMQRNIVDAQRGLSTAVDAFDMLGLSAEELERLSPEDQFALLAERISQIEDPTKRAAVAQMVFGRAGAELIPLLNEGAAGMDRLRKKARELGITMSDDDAKAAAKLTDALSDVWMAVKAGVFHIGSSLGGSLTELAVRISETVSRFTKWVKENQGLIISIAKLAGALILGGAAAVMIGVVFSGLGAVIGGVVSVIGMIGTAIVILAKMFLFLVSPVGIVIAVLVALAAWFLTSTKAGGDALSWLGEQFKGLKDTAVETWGGIADALAAGDIKLAAKILWLTLKMEWQKGVHFLNKIWQNVVTFFVKSWTAATFSLSKRMVNMTADLQIAWVKMVDFMRDAWSVLLAGMKSISRTHNKWIILAWLKVKAKVTGKDTSDEQKGVIDRAEGRIAADQDKMLADIGERDQDRRRQLGAIEDQRRGTLSELDDDQRRRDADRDKKHRDNLAGTRKDLDDAKEERRRALARAKAGRAKTDDVDVDEDKPPMLPEMDKLDAGLDVAKQATETRGAFSAFAVRGMQTGGPVQRIAKATEKTAESTESIDHQMAERRGVLFSN